MYLLYASTCELISGRSDDSSRSINAGSHQSGSGRWKERKESGWSVKANPDGPSTELGSGGP